MCELFAMSSKLPTTVRLSLEEFSRHGGLTGPHKDGWGIAYQVDKDIRILKEALPASNSALIRFIQDHPPKSNVVLSHIRKATQGNLDLANCQPFARELGGRMHVFAHNGDLDVERLRTEQSLGSYRPIGDTDSEHAFCALLERLRPLWLSSNQVPRLVDRLQIVSEFAAEIRPLGPANFIYSDADVLIVHGHKRTQSDGSGIQPPGLHLLQRSCAVMSEPVTAPGLSIDGTEAEQDVVLIASVPLTNEANWQALEEGELVVLRAGTSLDFASS